MNLSERLRSALEIFRKEWTCILNNFILSETDTEEDERFIRPLSGQDYLVKALTPIEDFNAAFGSTLSDAEFDTMGGLIMHAFGHLPRRNESTTIQGFNFRVLNADKRQIHMLRVTLPTNNTDAE